MKKYKDLEQEYAALNEQYSVLLSEKAELEYELDCIDKALEYI